MENEKEKIEIIDNSGDRKYYTMLPNYILNHSSSNEQSLYAQMKKSAGETGKCYMTQETLANKLHWKDTEKVRKNIQKLLKRNWIRYIGKTSGKTHPIDTYEIVDLWKINLEHYEKERKNRYIFKRRGGKTASSSSGKTALKEKPNKEEKNVAIEVATIYPSFLDKLLKAKQRHVQVIGIWVRENKIELPNEDVYKSIIKRNLRPAKLLEGYRDEDIISTIKVLRNIDYLKGHFTIETIGKFIDDVVKENKKAKSGPKIVRWEEVKSGKQTIAMRPIYQKI